MADSPREFRDGTGPFPLGINSGVPPLLLSRLQASFAANTSFRGSYATNRPAVNKLDITYPSDEVQTAVESGLFQGATIYRPDFGAASLFAAISGRCFQFQFTTDTVTVTERTIPGDPNPATTTQAWLWQSENYIIWNDGISLPVFMDASTSRRSMGASQQLELTSVDFTVPALGSLVTVTLGSAYTGPFNMPIYIDGQLYQAVENANASYNVTLRNLTATPGSIISVGDEVTVEPSKLGYTTTANSFSVLSGSFPPGSVFTNFDISYPYTGPLLINIPLDGIMWRVQSTLNNGLRLRVFNLSTISPPGFNVPAHTLVQQSGSTAPNVPVGDVVTGFVAPAIGGTVTAELTQAYSGVDGAAVWINGEQWTITAIPTAPAGATVNVINLGDPEVGDSRGPTGTVGVGQFSTVSELPAGRMGDYGMGRNVMCLVDGQSYIISDIVGGGSGTPANSYRDSVLKVSENDYLTGGGVFRVPGAKGNIRAIRFPATLDASFGQGPAQIFTTESAYSFNVPVDRTTWALVTNPIQTQSLIAFGAQGQNATILVNSDIQFRSVQGWNSLIFARRQFTDAGGNTPMSHEVERIISRDDKSLLAYGSAVFFDNRVIYTAAPQTSSQGVIHPALVAMDTDPLTSIQQRLPPVYDGMWSALNVLQLVAGNSLGTDRCFAFGLNVPEEKIELYELLPTGASHYDNSVVPITWSVEGPALFLEDPKDRTLKRLIDGEIQVDEVTGYVGFQVFYRPDQWPCWVPWFSWSVCATQGEGLQPGFYPRMGFGEPSPDDCDSFTNRPLREGYTFQIKLVITGHCRVLGVNLRAIGQPQTVVAPQVCAPCVE